MISARRKRWAASAGFVLAAALLLPGTAGCSGGGLATVDRDWSTEWALIVVQQDDGSLWLTGLAPGSSVVDVLAELPVTASAGVLPETWVLGTHDRPVLVVADRSDSATVVRVDLTARRLVPLGRLVAGRTPVLSATGLAGTGGSSTSPSGWAETSYGWPGLDPRSSRPLAAVPLSAGLDCVVGADDPVSRRPLLSAWRPFTPGVGLTWTPPVSPEASGCGAGVLAAAWAGTNPGLGRAGRSDVVPLRGAPRALAVTATGAVLIQVGKTPDAAGELLTVPAAAGSRVSARPLPALDAATALQAGSVTDLLVTATVVVAVPHRSSDPIRVVDLPGRGVMASVIPG